MAEETVNQAARDEEQLINRISECEEVLGHLQKCTAFKVIKRDLALQEKNINDHWHLLADGSDQLKEMRITKFAVMHLLNLEQGYKKDLADAKHELEIFKHPEKHIHRDYDPE